MASPLCSHTDMITVEDVQMSGAAAIWQGVDTRLTFPAITIRNPGEYSVLSTSPPYWSLLPHVALSQDAVWQADVDTRMELEHDQFSEGGF